MVLSSNQSIFPAFDHMLTSANTYKLYCNISNGHVISYQYGWKLINESGYFLSAWYG